MAIDIIRTGIIPTLTCKERSFLYQCILKVNRFRYQRHIVKLPGALLEK